MGAGARAVGFFEQVVGSCRARFGIQESRFSLSTSFQGGGSCHITLSSLVLRASLVHLGHVSEIRMLWWHVAVQVRIELVEDV
jgi:hypothetical protein